MNVSQTIAKLIENGTIVSREVMFSSNVKPKASCKTHVLRKLVTGRYFLGQEYAKDGDSDGSGESSPLPWGEWSAYPFTITHRETSYLRLTPDEEDKPYVAYTVDGEKVTKSEFAEFLTPANAAKLLGPSEKPDCITVKIENVLSIL